MPGASFTYGVAAGVDGNIWFTDTLGNIGRFVIATQAITLFSGSRQHASAERPHLGPGWQHLVYEHHRRRRRSIRPHHGRQDHLWRALGRVGPQSIVAGPDNAIWVSVIDNRVLRVPITTGVVTITSVATQGAPGGITLGNDGNIWFAEGTSIGRITP